METLGTILVTFVLIVSCIGIYTWVCNVSNFISGNTTKKLHQDMNDNIRGDIRNFHNDVGSNYADLLLAIRSGTKELGEDLERRIGPEKVAIWNQIIELEDKEYDEDTQDRIYNLYDRLYDDV